MNQLVCEACGGTDLFVQGGVLVCRTCGAKQSDQTVPPTDADIGAAKVRISGKKDLRLMAQRMADNGDFEAASNDYAMLAEEKPQEWDARFYADLYALRHKSGKDAETFATNLLPALYSVFDAMRKDNQMSSGQKWITMDRALLPVKTFCTDYVEAARSEYAKCPPSEESTLLLDAHVKAIANLQKSVAELLDSHFSEIVGKEVAAWLKCYVNNFLLTDVLGMSYASITAKYYAEQLETAEARIKEIEPDYISQLPSSRKRTRRRKIVEICCYIVLAVGGIALLTCLFLNSTINS